MLRCSGEKNVSFRGQRVFTNDHLVTLEIRQGEEIAKFRQLRKGEPGQSIDATQPVKVGTRVALCVVPPSCLQTQAGPPREPKGIRFFR